MDLLIQFVGTMQTKFPNVIFRFEYDNNESQYRLWHTFVNTEDTKQFLASIGELIQSLFIPNDFYDYYLDYNADFSQKFNDFSQWICSANEPCSSMQVVPIIGWDTVYEEATKTITSYPLVETPELSANNDQISFSSELASDAENIEFEIAA